MTDSRYNKIEIRATNNEPTKITGIAVVYNSPSLDMGFTEYIAPGAFTKSLSENNNIRLLFNHDDSLVIASRNNGTLKLTDKPDGLYFEGLVSDEFRNTTYFASIERKDIDGCSFMFQPLNDKWGKDANGNRVRTITEAKIFECSCVTFPAYPATSCNVRNRIQDLTHSLETRAKRLKNDKLTKEEIDELRTIWLSINAIIDDDDDDEPEDDTTTQISEPVDTDTTTDDDETNNIESRGAIPYHKYPLARLDQQWDAGEVVKALDTDGLKKVCAWYDETKPDDKESYKLPHHDANFQTNLHGVYAAMGALLGAQGGVDIPDSDRQAVYNHLKKHYDDFGKTAPDFKRSLPTNEAELRKLDEMRLFVMSLN
jgi:HK97 family phage prohead protease